MAKGSKLTGQNDVFAPAISDDRFSRLQTDPRFLRPNREESKVVVDDRFKGLLSGQFPGNKKKGRIDRYGRKVRQDAENGDEDEMHRLYRLEKEEENEASGSGTSSSSDEEEQESSLKIDYARGEGQLESSEDDSSSEEESTESESGSDFQGITIGSAAARRKDKQRLRFNLNDKGEDDPDITAAASDLQVGAGDLAELDARAERTVRREAAAAKRKALSAPKRVGDTSRLAVVNMDWDHIRAIDLYKVFSSLVSPAGRPIATIGASSKGSENVRERGGDIVPVKGRVLSVRIYPSNFGLERMTKENQEGPPRDIFKRGGDGSTKVRKKSQKSRKQDSDDSDESGVELFELDEGGDFDEEALRNYQLERLRYFYAIVTFDSSEAARHIMNEVDGTEMERTANVFDLSFVPTEMTFPEKQASKEDLADEGWRDEATEVTDGSLYKGVDFTTDALRHSKVKLTWDADDPQRSKITRQVGQEPLTVDAIRDEDFKAYLASDSEGSDDEGGGDDGGKYKMRSLLGLDEEEGGEMADRKFGKSKSRAFEDGRKTRKGDVDGAEGGGDMQITFMPGLSEAAQRKKKGQKVEEKEESTLEKYMRKQREKKEKRRGQGKAAEEEEEEEEEEAGEDDAEATKTSKGRLDFNDPFFASDNEGDFEEALAAEQEGRGKERKSKKSQGKPADVARNNVDAQDVVSREELQLMAESDSEGGDDDATGHFSIKDILKAEQEGKGKKSRWAKKKEKKNRGRDDGRENEVQENFAINVQDERFQGVFNDHRFALDPSHPSFLKTKNMEKLVAERRNRDKKSRKDANQVESKAPIKETQTDLQDLVKSVKRSASGKLDQPFRKKAHRVK
ncbi:hypothetical protein CBS101457_000778 [Exobasidium rhododendri]|nr:hypothetical protein CBS101457_000778 [Exobasidium rhododendri]